MDIAHIGLVGVGGFAGSYLKSLKRCSNHGLTSLDAVVIRNPNKDNYEAIEEELRNRGTRIYRSFEDMLEQEKDSVDIIAVPSGIHHHADLSIKALEAGYHVICEKPVAGTPEDAYRMRDATDSTGRTLTIGYQNIFSPSIQRIKEIKLSQRLGRMVKAKTFALWPRPKSYYERNGWAGKISYNGKRIYDSPLQNATAHFLQNMLYVAGNTHYETATPQTVYGECYKAKDIESADTQFIRITTKEGIRLEFAVTHACSIQEHPYTEYRFAHGLIRWFFDGRTEVFSTASEDRKVAPHKSDIIGRTGPADKADLIEQFDNEGVEIFDLVFSDTVRALQENRQPLCTVHNSLQQTMAIDALFKSSGGVHAVPEEYLTETHEHNTVIRDIETVIRKLFATEKSFFEEGVPWAREGREVRCDSIRGENL